MSTHSKQTSNPLYHSSPTAYHPFRFVVCNLPFQYLSNFIESVSIYYILYIINVNLRLLNTFKASCGNSQPI